MSARKSSLGNVDAGGLSVPGEGKQAEAGVAPAPPQYPEVEQLDQVLAALAAFRSVAETMSGSAS